MSITETVGVIVQIVTCLAILFAAWQLMFHARQMHRDFEMLYVQRYWELMDRRSDVLITQGTTSNPDRVVALAYPLGVRVG